MPVTFTTTDLKVRTGDVLHSADIGPVELMRHGRRSYVILRAESYDEVVGSAPSVRTVFRTEDSPAEADFLFAELPPPFDDDEAARSMGVGVLGKSADNG